MNVRGNGTVTAVYGVRKPVYLTDTFNQGDPPTLQFSGYFVSRVRRYKFSSLIYVGLTSWRVHC